ncbi:MAG: phosphate ABC transporter substrate-binding protein [Bacillota bacterium]|nr:phosphate ABC transporter substrate-binding protein [Bacillota bacterium]
MKTKSFKFIAIAMVLVIALAGLLSGCGSSSSDNASGSTSSSKTPAASSDNSKVSGSITTVGSTALQPLVKEAADQYMAKNSDAQIQVQGGGSGTGLTQVSTGAADIGDSDLFAEEKLPADQAKGLTDHKVCVVGFAAVVNSDVTVDSLTQQQLIDVFTGKVTNWKDLGGADEAITIINRPTSSGTRATFKKYALKGAEEATGKALNEDSSGTVRQMVAQTKGSISYLALSYIDSSIKALKFEGVEANADNITSGKYPIWSYEHMYTKGDATGLAKAFLDYMMSDDVQKTLVSKLKFISISDMKVSR